MGAAIVGLLMLTAACGPRVAPERLAAAEEHDPLPPSPSVTAAVPDVEATAAAPDASPDPASDSAPPSETPSAKPSPNYGKQHNNGVVRIELSATCVKPGDLLVVTLRTPPKAGLGMIIGYSDHQAHGAMLTGESDANGVYVWRVVVEPTVPDGEAKVLVTSTGPNWEQEGGGTADAVFRVSRTGC